VNSAGSPVYFKATTNGPGNYYTCSGPGALYYSVQAAGIAAINYIIDTHGNVPREYGNDIYQDQNGVYSFNEPIQGADCTIDTQCSVDPSQFTEPDGTEIMGIFHTHPFGGEFSYPNDYAAPDALQVPAFLGNPRGCIQMYVPVPGQQFQGAVITLQGSPSVCP
jgi:hypothetical protein